MSYSFVDPNGDTISVSAGTDGTVVTSCSNGTVTDFHPDGSNRSENDPFGGAPIVFERSADGSSATYFPDGTRRFVTDDGTVMDVGVDGALVTRFADGSVSYTAPDGTTDVGHSLETAAERGQLTELNVISTGENVGTVAIVEFVHDGSAGLVHVPASRLVPNDTDAHQTLDTQPAMCLIDGAGHYVVEVTGLCHQDPFKPPADAGDTNVILDPLSAYDVGPYVGAITRGVIGSGAIPADLVGDPDDTLRTLDQVTRWIEGGATDADLYTFLYPRLPSSFDDDEKNDKLADICNWGHQLVNKTANLGKQQSAVTPEVPPGFFDEAKPVKPEPKMISEEEALRRVHEQIRAIRRQLKEIYDKYKWNWSAKGGKDWHWKLDLDDDWRSLQIDLRNAQHRLYLMTGDSLLPEEKAAMDAEKKAGASTPQPNPPKSDAPKVDPPKATPPKTTPPNPPPKGPVEP